MITTIVILSIILFLSLSLNGAAAWFSYWYAKEAAIEIKILSHFIEDSKEVLTNYMEHLNSVHDLEMFYGDETLKSLISHGSSIVKYFEDFDNPLIVEREEEEEEDE